MDDNQNPAVDPNMDPTPDMPTADPAPSEETPETPSEETPAM